MKTNTRSRAVEIDSTTLFNLFISAIYGDAKDSTGKDRILYTAFGYLVGISDVDAVKMANTNTKKEHRITVTQFRKWLLTVFSEFARVMLEANND